MNLFHQPALIQLIVKLAIDLLMMLVIVRLIYYARSRDKEYVFTLFVFNLLVFLVCYYMGSLELSIGFGFGLFALFGILRYRTITVPIKEMTYLFTVIVVAIINALASEKTGLEILIASNLVIVAMIFILEIVWMKTQQGFKMVTYEKIENIKPENHSLLLSDLKTRTGLNITTLEIESVNFLNDTAVIKIYYSNSKAAG